MYLAFPTPRNKDVPCCQVSVDKGLARKVGHSRGHLTTEAEEGVVIDTHPSLLTGSHVEQVIAEVSSSQQLKDQQNLK